MQNSLVSRLQLLVFLFALVSSNTSFSKPSPLADAKRQAIKTKTLKGHKPLEDYSFARRMLMNKVHLKKDREGHYVEDVYCGQIIHLATANTMPDNNILNTEHTWPQSRFNRSANVTNQKADLHHLYPTNSKANGRRGNDIFTDVSNNNPIFTGCPESKFGESVEGRVSGFEPPDAHKGNVARAIFYFAVRYEMEISKVEEDVLRHWNQMDPVDAEEQKRNDTIETIQGNRNPFIDDAELAELVEDF
jgi:deoxyribonuclease-1